MDFEYLKNKRLLLVDDEPELLDMVVSILKEEGFNYIATAKTVKDALALADSFQPELAILDVMLPDGNGFYLMEKLKHKGEYPILFLTARGEDEDKIKGFGLGADDYVIKPFLPKELIFRIMAILRRSYKGENPLVKLQNSEIDFDRAEVIKNGEHIALTAKEHNILAVLYRNAGRIVTIDALCEAAWGDNPFGYENSLLSCLLLIILNFALLAIFTAKQSPNAYPWKTAEEVAETLRLAGDGEYELPDPLALELKNSDVWAIFIDNETKHVIWKTDNLPKTIPMTYTLSDIASLTRGYIDGYPTFTGEAENGLVVLGYPKDSFWKHMWPSWDYYTIANLPKTVLSVFALNIALIFLIYIAANSKLLKSIKPIVNGIQSLSTGEPVYVKEKGLLSELAMSINKTSEILQSQNDQLRRKETARANWIAGVSHDIRTPLSMVMGYASQLKDDTHLNDDERRKAIVILKQSERMKNLINDLNLASKLEYNMQPINLKTENIIAIVRQVIVDFINLDINDTHPIIWETDESLTVCHVNIDKELIKRAVSNLIQNCINHNGQGCKIYVSVTVDNGKCTVTVDDDGVGVTDDQIEKLNNAPHYMVCDENTTEQRHGLGLLIVKQIVAAHGGTTVIGYSSYGGFSVKLTLPMEE